MIGGIFFYLGLAIFVFLIWLGGVTRKEQASEQSMSKFDPVKYYKEHSKEVRMVDGEEGSINRTFVIYTPIEFMSMPNLVYLGDKDSADFYFFHNAELLYGLKDGSAYLSSPVKDTLGDGKEYERQGAQIDGYISQTFYFPNMNDVGYVFVCKYKIEYSEGKNTCANIIKTLIPSSISPDLFNKNMLKLKEKYNLR